MACDICKIKIKIGEICVVKIENQTETGKLISLRHYHAKCYGEKRSQQFKSAHQMTGFENLTKVDQKLAKKLIGNGGSSQNDPNDGKYHS